MQRYIAVDSGKFATKVAEYLEAEDCVRKFSIRTKVSDGDMRDDAVEENTVIVEMDGIVYKIGNGARGTGVALDTDKKTDVHKLCTLTALATVASAKEVDVFDVAIGMPAKDWAVVSKRMDFKDYILPAGEMSVIIKKDSKSEPVKKTFCIRNRYVFPESIGALFMDETIGWISPNSITGVLDMGNLNLNATLWQGIELIQDKSSTAELGGAILIQELSQELSSGITACDELITANILKMPTEYRHLPDDMNLSKEAVAVSAELIKRVTKEHAQKVKRTVRARNWSLDITRLVAIGGTSADIETDLKEVFGESIMVLPNSNYCNVLGYLRIMCSKEEVLNKIIPFKSAA